MAMRLRRTGLAALAAGVFLLFAPASASAQHHKADLPGRIDAAADALSHEPKFSRLSVEGRREIIRFAAGNLLFVVLHELGHALITEMGLPVLGREEDAADAFAAVAMLRMNDEFSGRVLTEAARGWFMSDRRDRAEKVPMAFYDEHSLSSQRAYQIVCYLVGSDREKFAALATEMDMPEERQVRCTGDYSNALWSWNKVLEGHTRTTQTKTPITVRYHDGGENNGMIERSLKHMGLLETVARRASDMYVWRAPFTLVAKTCGETQAAWNLQERTLTICYELAREFALLYEAYGSQPVASVR